MIRKSLICLMFLYFVFNAAIFAQNDDLRSQVDYRVNKMQKVLGLTDSQATAIRPIIKDYFSKREAVIQESQNEGIVDHLTVKSTLKGLRDNEYQALRKILNEDQMQKWINKEELLASLNPDSSESVIDDEPTLGANGANFKF